MGPTGALIKRQDLPRTAREGDRTVNYQKLSREKGMLNVTGITTPCIVEEKGLRAGGNGLQCEGLELLEVTQKE